jgi:hypothetical protein
MSHRRAPLALLLGCALAATAAPACEKSGASHHDAPGAARRAAPAMPDDRPYLIDMPADWALLPERSPSMPADLPPSAPEPRVPHRIETQTWRGPQVELLITWILADTPAGADGVHRLWSDTFVWSHNSVHRRGGVKALRGTRSNTGDMLKERYDWQNPANGTTSMSRTLAFLTVDAHPAVVTARCVIASIDEAAVAGPRATCERTLTSLRVPPGGFVSMRELPQRPAAAPQAAPETSP